LSPAFDRWRGAGDYCRVKALIAVSAVNMRLQRPSKCLQQTQSGFKGQVFVHQPSYYRGLAGNPSLALEDVVVEHL
jgi:hypothetical protein